MAGACELRRGAEHVLPPHFVVTMAHGLNADVAVLAVTDGLDWLACLPVLQPGAGVHVPLNAPHWVKNLDEVSISLSITFHTEHSES